MMNIRRTSIRYLTLLVCLALPYFSAAVLAQTPITGRDITMTIVTTAGAPVAGATADGYQLVAVPHVHAQGERIEALLRANGIFPDTDAYGLVYDLNPGVTSFDQVAAGTSLSLPKVVATNGGALPAGSLFSLAVEASLKRELAAKITAANQAAAAAPAASADRFKSAADRTETLALINSIKTSLGVIHNVIRGKVRPLSGELLSQVSEEAEIFRVALANLTQPGLELTACDRENLTLIDKDLLVKRRTLTDVRDPAGAPARWLEARVVVRTLRSGDGAAVPNLRIYYVAEALYGKRGLEKSFDQVSSPSERTIPEANYRIWAGRPGDTTPVTEVKRLEVRRSASGNPISVDLIVQN